jgi:hypothetical protein
VVTQDAGCACVLQCHNDFTRLRPKRSHVPKADERVNCLLTDVGQHRVQSGAVAVNVRNQGDAHEEIPFDDSIILVVSGGIYGSA